MPDKPIVAGLHCGEVQADLIHSPATLGPPRRDVPVVVTMHDMLYWSHPQYMSTPLYTAPVKWMEKVVSRGADRVDGAPPCRLVPRGVPQPLAPVMGISSVRPVQ
mgnify:CR=1 FL=1